jgi:hypothetical protein
MKPTRDRGLVIVALVAVFAGAGCLRTIAKTDQAAPAGDNVASDGGTDAKSDDKVDDTNGDDGDTGDTGDTGDGSKPQNLTVAVETSEDTPQDFTIDVPETTGLTGKVTIQPTLGIASVGTGTANVVHYVPTANKFGTDTFTLELSRAGKIAFTVKVNVTVKSVNDIPILTPLAVQSVFMNSSQTFALAASDADDPAAALVFALGTKPLHGVATLLPPVVGKPQLVKYAPTAKYFGPDALTWTVQDSAKASSAKPGDAKISVLAEGPLQLVGTWSHAKCGTASNEKYIGTQVFTATTYTTTITTYAADCVTRNSTSTGTGTYTLGAKLALADKTNGIPFNQVVSTQTAKPLTAAIVTLWNTTGYCGRKDWKLNTAYSLATCGFAKDAKYYSVFRPQFTAVTSASFFPHDAASGDGKTPAKRPTRVLTTPFVRL